MTTIEEQTNLSYSITVDAIASDTGINYINITDNVTVTCIADEQKVAEAKPISIQEIEKEKPLSKEEWIRGQIALGENIRRQRILKFKNLNNPFSTTISSDVIIVSFGLNNVHSVIMTDTNKKGAASLFRNKNANSNSGHSLPILISDFYYDKNMNPLSVDYSNCSNRVKSKTTFNTVNTVNLNITPSDIDHVYDRYIVIDKKRFIESKGKDIRIKFRQDVSFEEILHFKRKMIKKISDTEDFINKIRTVINNVYDEENFEIVYKINFRSYKDNFAIFVQFPDLIIRNSIEIEHKIHNLVAIMEGSNYGKDQMSIQRGLKGIRTKYNPKDAHYGYIHSHLPAGITSYPNSFCMGSNHFLSHANGYVDELELESLLIGMFDHISWESLEGGPYYTMENIGLRSRYIYNINFSKVIFDSYDIDASNRIIEVLNNVDLSVLLNAFELTLDEQKNITYKINYSLFFDLFTSVLDEKIVKTINGRYDLAEYLYNPNTKKFSRESSGRMPENINNNEELIKSAREKISRINPIYMNGRYIFPELIEQGNDEIIEKEIVSITPDMIVVIAKYIHYLLLTELKNESRK